MIMLLTNENNNLSKQQQQHKYMMNYKGYTASLEIDVEAEIIFGRVLDINDVVTFKGKTVEEARQEFCKSVDC